MSIQHTNSLKHLCCIISSFKNILRWKSKELHNKRTVYDILDEYDYLGSGIGILRTRRVAPFPEIIGAISSPLFQCKKVIFPCQKCLKRKSVSSLSLR
ncbi:Peptidase S24/S26A/S26B/S26C family protein [Trifolium repens]|nr:Peptidase S24/S26A/S26B/S26C family protein [Trifolium repens]